MRKLSKVLVVPDIHLKVDQILDKVRSDIKRLGGVDRVIFLGDYFDDWGKTWDDQAYRHTISELLQFKEEFPSVFLLGNHDATYLLGESEHFSNQNPEVQKEIRDFLQNVGAKLAHIEGDFTLSHAGCTHDPTPIYLQDVTKNQESLNQVRYLYQFSDAPYLWIRPDSLEYRDYTKSTKKQIVGHTPVKKAKKIQTLSGNDVWLLDTWSTNSSGDVIGDQALGLIKDGKRFSLL